MLRELSDGTNDNRLQIFLEGNIEEICMKNERCSECFSELHISKEEEYRGGYMGEPAYETVNTRRCKTCGQVFE